VDVDATLEAEVSCERLFEWVDELDRYPQWLEIVPRAVPVDPLPGDEGPAWSVDLRGQVGPLARSKRLRMVRTVHDAPNRVVFERREDDGRRHSPWVLTVAVDPTDEGSALRMHLHYGGRLAGRPLELLLAREIDRSRDRLRALLET
jgi:Polyketide cyclase / dehydrase and lipid transport